MKKVLLLATLATTVVLLACSGPVSNPTVILTPEHTPPPSPTQEPTAATAPTATLARPPATEATPVPAAAATREPIVATTPTPASTPKDETPAGVLSPLSLHDPMFDDPEAVSAVLSEAELACIKEISPVMHRRWPLIVSGYGDHEEREKVIGCLEDEILARVFLADIAEGIGPLSLETSSCVRAAFNEIDPRSMLLAKDGGYPEHTLNSAMAAWLVTIACLNDEEWETADERLREDSEPREWMQCMMGKLGGPGEMAVVMTKDEEWEQKALSEAAEDCAEEKEPLPGETPAAPAATPEPASTPEPSSIAPLDPGDSADMLSRLTQEERDCITEVELLTGLLAKRPDADYEDFAQPPGCLEDETLLDVHPAFLAWYFQDLGGMFREDTASCIRNSLDGINLGDNVGEVYTAKDDLVRQAHSAFWELTVFYCLSEEEAALAAPDSGITEEEYDGLICTVDAFGGLEEFAEAYWNSGPGDFIKEFLTKVSGCLRG